MIQLNENQRAAITERWLLKKDGKPNETIEQMFWRVAGTIAKNEEDKQLYYDYISAFRFILNTPTHTGAGTALGNLSACFVLPITDDMGKEPNGIFDTLKNAALIQQTGGGVGFDFSPLRPEKAIVKSSGGYASGPVSFMRAYNGAFDCISQGGIRRSANMAILRIDHPDIVKFVTCKDVDGELHNFNISVAITNEFMQAVLNDADFDLQFDGKVYETVSARRLFDLIAAQAHKNGEPGIWFVDAANADNPLPGMGEYSATNPCQEMPLLPFESCNLGHLNLATECYVIDGKFQWKVFARDVGIGVRILNDVLDANKFVPAVPELKEAALQTRRIGLGFTGLADLLVKLGLRYGSNEAIAFCYQLMEYIRYYAMWESVNLAIEFGSFPAIEKSIYNLANFQFAPKAKPDWIKDVDFGRPFRSDYWDTLCDHIRFFGIRNSLTCTIAPTGTTSTAAGVDGYGCEPMFALAHIRTMQTQKGERKLQYLSNSLKQFDISQDDINQIAQTGTMQGVDHPAKHVLVTAMELSPEEHIKMQAALQVHNDSSISKTVNLPASATISNVKEAYKLAWELGCKGITVYRDKSREGQVLEVCEHCDENPVDIGGTFFV